MNACSRNGEVWTGEHQDGFWIYRDSDGNLYESREVPVYQIVMNNAMMGSHGIQPFHGRDATHAFDRPIIQP